MTKWLLMLLLMVQYTLPVHLTTAGKRTIPLNSCLVSGWPMNEGTGTTLNDVSGNANTINVALPNTGSLTWASNAGFPGVTAVWDSTHMTTLNADSTNASLTNFDGTTPFSVSTWMKASATSQQALVSTASDLASDQGWELLTGFPTNAMLFFVANSNSNRLVVYGSTNVLDGAKHFLMATYDGSRAPSGVHLYVDGSTQTQTTYENDLTATAAGGNPVAVAQRYIGTVGYSGVQAFTEIYNCVVTPTQVATYYAGGPGIY